MYGSTGCHVAARAYRTAERSGPPPWDSNRIPLLQICVGGHNKNPARLIAPGDTLPTRLWALILPASAVLGDSLPPGRYYFAVLPPLEEFNPPPPIIGSGQTRRVT